MCVLQKNQQTDSWDDVEVSRSSASSPIAADLVNFVDYLDEWEALERRAF